MIILALAVTKKDPKFQRVRKIHIKFEKNKIGDLKSSNLSQIELGTSFSWGDISSGPKNIKIVRNQA